MSHRFLRHDQPGSAGGAVRLPEVELEIIRGQARNRRRAVAGPVYLIGQASDCDLVLGDSLFAEVHAYLYVTEEGVSLRHLGADPELSVSGRAVETAWLRDGDRIRTGPYEFQMHIRWPSPAPNYDEVPGALVQPAPLTGALERPSPEAVVRQLLAEVRRLVGDARPLLSLYVEPQSPWQSVTAAQGVSIRRHTA